MYVTGKHVHYLSFEDRWYLTIQCSQYCRALRLTSEKIFGKDFMNYFGIAITFILLTVGIGVAVAKFVVGSMPLRFQQAASLQLVVGYGFAVIGVMFLMQWGYDPIIISVGANDLFLDPRRWWWWFLAALFIGTAEGFLFQVKVLDPVEPVEPVE